MTLRLVPSVEPENDDTALWRRGCAGDREALQALYVRYAREVARWAQQLVGPGGDVDDVVQETFIIAFRKLSMVKNPASLRSWLASTASNVARHRFRRQTRRERLGHQLGLVSPQSGDARRLGELEALYQQLAHLDDDLRVPWVMRKLCDEDWLVVAEACEVSVATAKRRVSEADAWLEERLSHG